MPICWVWEAGDSKRGIKKVESQDDAGAGAHACAGMNV
jgi:hypothetical protein